MRKLFKNHHIYTFSVGILALFLVFSQPPLKTDHLVLKSRDSSEKQLKPKTTVEPVARVEAVTPIVPARPKAIGTVIEKQTTRSVSALPSASPRDVSGEITGSLSGLTVPKTQGVAGTLMQVDADNLRMRDGPSSSAGTIATFGRGTEFEQMTVYGKWVQVRSVENGTTGWMFADYLAPVQ